MVNNPSVLLDRTFAALADPTRRELLATLRERQRSVTELAKPLSMSLPGVMKHLQVLVDAGLVTRQKTGRTVTCSLAAMPMQSAAAWLSQYERHWDESLDRLDDYLHQLQRGRNDER